jgi:hypothetical protein
MNRLTVDSIFVYLCQQESWVSDIQIAAAHSTSMPVTRKLLAELGDEVEHDGDGNWRIVKTTEVEIVAESNSQLTLEEEKKLTLLERRVEKGFYLAGAALKQIREAKLYRHRDKTFEDYCRARFNFSRRNADYLIIAVEVIDNLLTSASQKMRSIASQKYQFLPTSTRQALPLSKLPPEQQVLAWEKALDNAQSGNPSGKLVAMVVEEMRNQPKRPNELKQSRQSQFQVNSVVRIVGKDNRELKPYLSCWGVIDEVREDSYRVTVFGTVLERVVCDELSLLESAEGNETRELIALFTKIREKLADDVDVLSILNLLARKPRPQISQTVLKMLMTLVEE